ncbi:MAG: DUF445 family protein [Gemmatimonadota bacterium]
MLPTTAETLRAALTVAFGAMAGGITNRVAIWMLFHPYRPVRLFGRRVAWLQGALPKNQARLARTVGDAVGTRLLTPADISAELQDPGLRGAFEERVQELLLELVRQDGPALADLLPTPALAELDSILTGLFDEVHGHCLRALEAPGFAAQAEQILADLADSLPEESLAEAVHAEQAEALRARADEWLARLAGSEALEQTVRRHLRGAAAHVLGPGRTLEELIPVGVVAAVEHAINDYLPLVMERLGRLLEDPDARDRVERTVHELLDRFMRDLKFHQRVVAKLIITEETVDRVLRTLESEGADQLAELLHEPEMQTAMAHNVNEAIVEFLRRPTTSVLGAAEDPQVESALEAIAEWIVGAVRDAGARRFLLGQLEEAALRVGERSWGEVVALLPGERIGGWLAAALRSRPGRSVYDSVARDLADRILHRPVAGLARFVREEAVKRLADVLSPPAWEWISGEIPLVAEKVRVSDRVEEKIRGYPLQELEGLVRSVTERELNLIVRLGYVLGAIIGAALVGIGALLS